MLTKEEMLIKKLYTCPLTGQVFCHPVLASDGVHYELMALLQGPLISLKTCEPITHIQYDLLLKSTIEQSQLDNHYPFYEKQDSLNQLLTRLEYTQSPWVQSAYASSAVGFGVMSLAVALWVLTGSTLKPFDLLYLLSHVGALDFGIRVGSRHKFGFFEGGAMLLNAGLEVEDLAVLVAV